MQTFTLEELTKMPTSNLSKMVHNIWFQKSLKKGACLYAMTFDDYMWTFKYYYEYIEGCSIQSRFK